MALLQKQNDTRTELQKRIAADLQKKTRQPTFSDAPDGVEDSQFIKGTKQTTSLAGVWIAIVIAAIAILVWVVATTFR